MGYEDQTCKGVEGNACGGMKNVNGVKQVYGGTLPARIFDRTFEILREIQADKRRAAAGEAETTAEPSPTRSEEHTSELQSLMRISYAVFCLKKKKKETR